jgi:hypothetical protein
MKKKVRVVTVNYCEQREIDRIVKRNRIDRIV